ncbi:hypothetical protein OG900_08880 [Streptomyces sp. NBC_00433]
MARWPAAKTADAARVRTAQLLLNQRLEQLREQTTTNAAAAGAVIA